MNTKQNVATVAMVAVVLMAAALTPSLASAQGPVQGKFTLPCTTYWGNSVLPAGEYSFRVDRINSNVAAISVRGAAAIQHVNLSDYEPRSEKSSLTLAKSNGIAVARTLFIAEMRRSFTLPVAKGTKEMTASLTKVAVIMGDE